MSLMVRRNYFEFGKLFGLHILGWILRLFNGNWTAASALLIALSFIAMLVKVRSLVNERYERHKIFEKGGIPSVGNKNPFSGNLFEMIVPDNNLHIMNQYHRKLGKTYGLFYGPDPWILTTDLDLVHKIFDSNRVIDITQLRLPFMTEMNKSLVQVQGDDWRRIRRSLNPSFTHRQMKSDNVYQNIDEICNHLIKCIEGHRLESTREVGQGKSRIVDVLYNFKKFAIEIIFKVAYGRENGANMEPYAKDELIEKVHAGSKLVATPVVWLSIMFEETQHFFGRLVKLSLLGRIINLIHSVLDDSLEKRRQKLAFRRAQGAEHSLAPRKMIDTIIESLSTEQIDDETLKANLFFIFVAGFETSANTLAILFWQLAQHPEVQEKLRQTLLTEGEKSTYLDWCIKETLRLYPAVPGGVGRVLSEDLTTAQGQKIFKGTTVIASIYSIHHEEEYWGSDVEEFRPERFAAPLKHPLQYYAFGSGPRDCIGKNLAMAEMTAIIIKLLLRYRIEVCDSTPKSIDFTSPNLIHMIIDDRIDLRFTELSSF